MSAQVSGFTDDKLYSRGAGGSEQFKEPLNNEDNENNEDINTTPYSMKRHLGSDKAKAAHAQNLKSSVESSTRNIKKKELKKLVSKWLISSIASVATFIISYLGFLLIPVIVIFLIIILIPGGAWVFNFVSNAKIMAGQ